MSAPLVQDRATADLAVQDHNRRKNESTERLVDADTWPSGHCVRGYRVEGVIGEGGFGVVHAARDLLLDRPVAIKRLRSSGALPAKEQAAARAQLLAEARLAAAFTHQNLPTVLSCWSDGSSTAFVMPCYEGPTLGQWLRDAVRPPSQRWLLGLAARLSDALACLHAVDVLHRDIAPDNILLRGTLAQIGSVVPSPVLLDFGAARSLRTHADPKVAAGVLVKPGYAPIEQHAGWRDAEGPWTDVYGLCAVLYTAVTGRLPVPAPARYARDSLVPAQEAARAGYSPSLLAAIDGGLAVRPKDRPQSIQALAQQLRAAWWEQGHEPGPEKAQESTDGRRSLIEVATRRTMWSPHGTVCADVP